MSKIRDAGWSAGVPRSITKITAIGLFVLVSCLGGFAAWAFTAPLAAAVIAQGSFVASGQNKIVQHLEGGVIEEIQVREGERVSAGQVLLRLDRTAADAGTRELALRRARLEAIAARLKAEEAAAERISWPPYLNERRGDAEVEAVMRSQDNAFTSSRRKLESDLAMLNSNMEAFRFRVRGYALQSGSMRRQLTLLQEENAAKTKLLRRGLVRKPDINVLRRAIEEAQGQIGRLDAEVGETNQQIARLEEQTRQTRAAYREAAMDELQTILGELESVREKWRSAANVLRRATIHTPVSGTIVRMFYHTPGGVVEPGKPIAEIIPSDVPLIIEVQVPRTDIDAVRNGQPATVRLSALNQRTTPVLEGRVIYVSADALSQGAAAGADEIYVARVNLPSDQLALVPGFKPTPGMPAEIMIQTAERTFFDYLSQPVRDSMARAFREH